MQRVAELIESLKRRTYNLNSLILENGGPLWKIEAASKIRKAQMVIFFVGERSHKSPYIGWEIQKAIKYGKPIYTVKLDPRNQNHEALWVTDMFTGEKRHYDKEIDFDALSNIVNDYESGNYKVFNQEPEQIDQSILLEQYKVFLQTSEDLVSRRQGVNSFYISLNSALIAIVSALFAFDFELQYKILIGALFAVVGIVLSVSWVKILVSYGKLNSSKMKIISCIEKQLPASLYDAEWAALSDRLNKKKYVSFTDSEKRVPQLFIIIYACLFVVMAVVFCLNM